MIMEELLKWMDTIEDSRQQAKVRHQIKDILVIVLFATLANADEWEDIAYFAEMHEEYLRKYIRLEHGIPSHDTIRRVIAMISPEVLQEMQRKWQELLNRDEGEKIKKIIAIDGKTMCGNKRNGEKPNHIVSAWCKEDGFCLGQTAVEEKSNEITAIPVLLEKINIKGQVVTIDAMGTQTAIAAKIRTQKADYVLALKGNQSALHRDITEYFSDEQFCKEIERCGGYKKVCEKAHGQLETREYYLTDDIKWLPQRENWPGLKSIGMERKTIQRKEGTATEYRYYIVSFKDDIELFSRAVRQHWSVEAMHWHLDVTFREDYNTTLDKIAAQNMNIIRKLCLSILKIVEIYKPNLSIKKKRFIIANAPERFIEQILCS